ncbi:P-loop containing nucleoside triphosphate hydrolase protein [Radiomyces spectabilis]|uniref:P-loop containing nucleoside triphosphate hydrolase protein n=1 Tax=Radiomyces spectabilis TaxID=64574 RepID=UPI002220129B|nr:P-loop containing nucleoside triphosphate hydrolase protein [Radiomyces spectabilis]KAI8394256.1 P-loop containing nucleoside triphosphate hydrolase protein [Radiomyces spectabilis]
MGLGKTLQAITFVTTYLQEIKNENPSIPERLRSNRILILAPLITLTNWVTEFYRWVPSDLESTVGHIYNFCDVSTEARGSISAQIHYLKNWFNEGGVLLMNYDRFRTLLVSPAYINYRDQLRTMLLNPGPSMIILDEGHRIKSKDSQITNLVNSIATYARVSMTGYPLQNNLAEYYYMINFVSPGALGDMESFRRNFQSPIENVYAESPQSVRMLAKARLLELQLMASFFVDRKNNTILNQELPGKTEYYIACRLTSIQFDLYQRFLESVLNSQRPLIDIILFRAICNHPAVFEKMLRRRQLMLQTQLDAIAEPTQQINTESAPNRPHDDFDYNPTEVVDENELKALEILVKKCNLEWAFKFFETISDVENWKHSRKVLVLLEILHASRELGDKVVVVSHSIICLDYLQPLLATLSYSVSRIDGTTPQEERQTIIDHFNGPAGGKHVMLLSARAGGIGVNITGANRLVLFDLDWNPCYDEQSIGRVYRYGQKKYVYIYRLTTYSSIEQTIQTKNVHKRGISSRVIDNRLTTPQLRNEMTKYYHLPIADPVSKIGEIDFEITDPVMRRLLEDNNNIVEVSTGDMVTDTNIQQIEEDLDQKTIYDIRNHVLQQQREHNRRLRG